MKIKSIVLTILFALVLLANTKVQEMMISGNGIIDLDVLFNYADQEFPERAEYRWNDINPITDIGATLGRVLFYDKNLSVNNKISCASCHQQENAFGDDRVVSEGFNGEFTERHSMRLINVDFHADNFKFWDERASRLENMTTLPIQDEIEMGFSGNDGFPGIDSLIRRMENIDYYQTLFNEVYGDPVITEERMAFALAQFIRSIITFDSRFDEGFNSEGQEISDFPNFTEQENRGKRLFFNFPSENPSMASLKGAGCGLCHKAPSLDVIHLTLNNGVIGVAGDSTAIDLSVIRSPSLKNLVKPDGSSNGPFMHDGSLETLEDVVEHYNKIPFNPINTNQSGLLFPDPNGTVDLNLSDEDKEALIAFLKTFSGNDVYTNEKWSDPFDVNGDLQLINSASCTTIFNEESISICEGDSYEGYLIDGLYLDTFNLENGCDSIRSLELIVLPIESINEEVSICPGEEYNGFSEEGTYIASIPAESGCDTIYTLVIEMLEEDDASCIETSIQDLENLIAIQISPNPTQSILSISNIPEREYLIRITDLSGKILIEVKDYIVNNSDLDVSRLSNGLYVLQLKSSDNKTQYSTRFVKM